MNKLMYEINKSIYIYNLKKQINTQNNHIEFIFNSGQYIFILLINFISRNIIIKGLNISRKPEVYLLTLFEVLSTNLLIIYSICTVKFI